MARTFKEIAEHRRQGESDIDDASFALMLIGDLAEALDEFANTHIHGYMGSTENYMQGVVGRRGFTEPPQRKGPPSPPTEAEIGQLLAVATLYVNAFTDDEMMTLPERLRLAEIEAILDRHGRRY